MYNMLKRLGIITLGELKLFKDTQVQEGESLEHAIVRYFEEVFGNENN